MTDRNYIYAEIVERPLNGHYVAFFAVYDNGDRIFCYSDCITKSRQPPNYHSTFTGDSYDSMQQWFDERRCHLC